MHCWCHMVFNVATGLSPPFSMLEARANNEAVTVVKPGVISPECIRMNRSKDNHFFYHARRSGPWESELPINIRIKNPMQVTSLAYALLVRATVRTCGEHRGQCVRRLLGRHNHYLNNIISPKRSKAEEWVANLCSLSFASQIAHSSFELYESAMFICLVVSAASR
jgi:hypothetical protein